MTPEQRGRVQTMLRRMRARDAYEQVFGPGSLACADLARKTVDWMERQVLEEMASRKQPVRTDGEATLRDVVGEQLRLIIESNELPSAKLAKLDELLVAFLGYTLLEDTIRAVRADVIDGHVTRILETCL